MQVPNTKIQKVSPPSFFYPWLLGLLAFFSTKADTLSLKCPDPYTFKASQLAKAQKQSQALRTC